MTDLEAGTLVRKNINSGDIEPRKRGRLNPAWENGYIDETGNFIQGNPDGSAPAKKAIKSLKPEFKEKKVKAKPIHSGAAQVLEKIIEDTVNERVAEMRSKLRTSFETFSADMDLILDGEI